MQKSPPPFCWATPEEKVRRSDERRAFGRLPSRSAPRADTSTLPCLPLNRTSSTVRRNGVKLIR